MIELHIKTKDGQTRSLYLRPGDSLMPALRDQGWIEATCGGAASCGTCHIYFEKPDLAGTRNEDESYMLESLAEFVEVMNGSRLACQTEVTALQAGAAITIAPDV